MRGVDPNQQAIHKNVGGNAMHCTLYSAAQRVEREAHRVATARYRNAQFAQRTSLSTSKLNRIAAILEETP